jgi:hypothetical protein
MERFIWMFEIELEDGTRLDAYKHGRTRNYLHLDNRGRAFIYRKDGRYEEVEPDWLLALVLEQRDARWDDIIVRHNQLSSASLRWTRSATKHRISRERSRYVIKNCLFFFELEASPDAPLGADARVLFVGDDEGGIPIEVMAIDMGEKTFLVIHSMRLRKRYVERYEEAKNAKGKGRRA